MGKFDGVLVEEDTKILRQGEMKLGEIDVLVQAWRWEAILGESFIFVGSEVGSLTDEELERLVRSSPLVRPDSQITIKRSESGFTFVNFNFVAL